MQQRLVRLALALASGLPLMALMFVGDYLVRRCVLPPEQVAGLWQAVRAYRQVGMPPLH